VINLDRAPDRMARMARLLGEMGVAFARVPAFDGRSLPPPAAGAGDSSWRMTASEIATIRSHQGCWDLFEQSGDPACVILEDDVHFGRDFADFVAGERELPPDFDLIKIETTPNKVWLDRNTERPILGQRKLMRLASPHLGAAGYVLSRAGLAKIRSQYQGFECPIDTALFGPAAQALTIYQMVPSLVIQDNGLKGKNSSYVGFASDINRGRKPKVRGVSKIKREIARALAPYWPPGPMRNKWRLSYQEVAFE